MNHSQKIFMEQFDQPLRKHIIEFCNKISEKQYDVFILLARKAACFISVLEDLGFLSLNGIIVSERILEYNTDWLKGKKVAIIDDTIISGTSICKIIEKLERINIVDIFVYAFCINDYWAVDEMLKNSKGLNLLLKPYIRVDHTTSIRFCKEIVNALSVVPRPYNIDFPIYEKMKFTRANYITIIEDTNWKVINTATQLQVNNNICCISLNPKRKFLREFIDSLGFNFSNTLFVKLRIYSQEILDKDEKGQLKYISKIVPYVIFNPVNINFINDIIAAICKCEEIEDKNIINMELVSNSSKLLFVQYYFSERLFHWWVNYTEKIFEKKLNIIRDERSISLLFSPKIINSINKFKFCGKMNFDPEIYYEKFSSENLNYINNDEPINPFFIKEKLLKPFLEFYYKKELPARKIVKEKKKEAFKDTKYKDIISRLEEGISMFKLKQEISELINNSTDTNLILSTFLDNAIDTGLIVPITVEEKEKNRLYRGFRHGEEIIWADTNDKLLAVFFKQFVGGEAKISKLWFQKIMVLFLKLGLKEGFLSEYNLLTPENQKVNLIGIRSYLFGQVTVSYNIKPYQQIDYNPILDYETKSYWTSHRLESLGILHSTNKSKKKYNEESGYLNINFDKLYYKEFKTDIESNEVDDLDPEIKDKVLNIADLLKKCKDDKLLDDEKLVILTSCLNLHDNLASIGAELQIYSQQKLFDTYINSINTSLDRNELTIEVLDSLRNVDINPIWTAINSGWKKYIDYKKGEGIKLVNEIADKLSSDGITSRLWNRYWRTDIDLAKNKDDELSELNDRMGIILMDINCIMRYIHILLYELIYRNKLFENFTITTIEQINNINQSIDEKKDEKMKLSNFDKEELDFENASIIDNIDKQIKEFDSKKKSLNKKMKYWDNYIEKNIERIKSSYNAISRHLSSLSKNKDLIDELLLDKFKCFSNKEISNKIKFAINIMHSLQEDSKDTLEEFLLLVPQYGKINRKVKYTSSVHINGLSQEKKVRDNIAMIIKREIINFEIEEYDDQKNDKSIVLLRNQNVKYGKGYIIGAKGQFNYERLLKLSCRILNICIKEKYRITISIFPLFNKAKGILAYFNPQTKKYDFVKENLFEMLPENTDADRINIYTTQRVLNTDYNKILSDISKEIGNTFKINNLVTEDSELQNTITMVSIKSKKKIFISYSRKNVDYKDRLKDHLNILKTFEIVDNWSCEQIKIGSWDEQIKKELDESDIIIYMLSVDFFSSPYILQKEVQDIIEGKHGEKNILCIMVSEFVGLEKIEDYLLEVTNNIIPDNKKAILALRKFQYLPYKRKLNNLTKNNEEIISTLNEFVNNNEIDTALAQISNKILNLLKDLR